MTDLTSDLRPLANLRTAVGFDLDNPIAPIDLERHVVEERPILGNYQHSSINSVKERGSHGALRSQLFQSALRKARSVSLFDALRNSSLACAARPTFTENV